MCGIAGVVDFEGAADGALAEAMAGVLLHRGPDEGGRFAEGPSALAVRRLAIQDVLHGHQPAFSEDGRIAVVLNGEIYNFRELRAALEARGHRLASGSDTEVLPHLYEEHGDAFLDRLRGMFALALWDGARERLVLARDRLGKKPLFYTRHRGSLRFASEIKALFADRSLPREPDLEALHHYLVLQYVPAPWTAFAGIRALLPGQRIVVDRSGERAERWWTLSRRVDAGIDRREAAERVGAALREAVRLRMIADVPLGAFLSGGVDSSCVVAAMASESPEPVRTFTIGFEEAERDERERARIVARAFGTAHTEHVVRPDVAGLLPLLAWHFDQPLADQAIVPTYVVARETRRDVTVALLGDGGDEAFGGYPRVQRLARRGEAGALRRVAAAVAGLVPYQADALALGSKVRRYAARTLGPFRDAYSAYVEIFPEASLARIETAEMAAAVRGSPTWPWLGAEIPDGRDSLWNAQAADYATYLPGALLPKVDIATMAVSLEARSPMLDHAFVETAASLPSSAKLGPGGSKLALRDAFRGVVPDVILDGEKRGFGLPLSRWFRGELAPLARALLDSDRSGIRRFVRADAIRSLLRTHEAGRADHSVRIFALLMLELWLRTYVDAPPPLSPPAETSVADLA